MSFDDFVRNFQRLEICYLGPDSIAKDDDEEIRAARRKWEGSLFEGGWKRRVNAGGCRNYPCMFDSFSVSRLCRYYYYYYYSLLRQRQHITDMKSRYMP